jgi:stearoyl-CoA desaturase (delta-9 desaturase)
MAPNVTTSLAEVSRTPDTALLSSNDLRKDATKPCLKYRREIVWPNVVVHAYLNLAALYGAYLMLTSAKVLTGIWGRYVRYMIETEENGIVCRIFIKFKKAKVPAR